MSDHRSQSATKTREVPTTTRSISYGGYLHLRELLGQQAPLSEQHDEMLFIILHQTMELWMKQALHEIDAAQACIETRELAAAYKHLARLSRIQSVMTQSWEVLATMTPADYVAFRHVLGASSGFQSAQFRTLEFRLGLKNEAHLKHQEEAGPERHAMQSALERPSLYDATLSELSRSGLLAREVVDRRKGDAKPDAEIEAAWLGVYTDPDRHWMLYQLAEKLLDLDDALLSWRHKHLLTVERVIGRKRGTGGTEGVGYLSSTLANQCFPELWSLRTKL